jgi:hypothetical protein
MNSIMLLQSVQNFLLTAANALVAARLQALRLRGKSYNVVRRTEGHRRVKTVQNSRSSKVTKVVLLTESGAAAGRGGARSIRGLEAGSLPTVADITVLMTNSSTIASVRGSGFQWTRHRGGHAASVMIRCVSNGSRVLGP